MLSLPSIKLADLNAENVIIKTGTNDNIIDVYVKKILERLIRIKRKP
jgi:hypothetical protein